MESAGAGVARADDRRLIDLVDRILRAARRATTVDLVSEPARRRIRQLNEHLTGHVVPRARSLEAPLVILLLGPTGAGKSSLFNAMAGRAASRTGVLRPTTRHLVALARPEDRAVLVAEGGPLAGLDDTRLRFVVDADAPENVVIVDAPDIDSVEHENRVLADRLVEAADMAVFVTTATRYADRVPWDVLARVRDRGLPLTVLVNRLPPDPADSAVILEDLVRLMRQHDLTGGDRPVDMEIIPVTEGALDPSIEALEFEHVEPFARRIGQLAADRDERLELAAKALAGSLAGLEPHLRAVGDDMEHAAIDADRLRRVATDAFERELGGLRDELARGSFLRAEALRQWHAFVGADEITRIFSSGIGRLKATLSTIIKGPPPAPIAEVREQTLDDLRAMARVRIAEAARRTAAAWADEPSARAAIEARPDIWNLSPDLDDRLTDRLQDWVISIAEDIRETGGTKRLLARGASVGVNAAGIGVMLASFSHTGGLTGAEVGIAAATGFLNQKLLSALFGEAAMVEMIARARRRLMEGLGTTFGEELGRFDWLVPNPTELRELAAEMRIIANEVRTLPPVITIAAQPVMLREGPVPEPLAAGFPEAVPLRPESGSR